MFVPTSSCVAILRVLCHSFIGTLLLFSLLSLLENTHKDKDFMVHSSAPLKLRSLCLNGRKGHLKLESFCFLHLRKSTLRFVQDLKLKVSDLRLDLELVSLNLGFECKDLKLTYDLQINDLVPPPQRCACDSMHLRLSSSDSQVIV